MLQFLLLSGTSGHNLNGTIFVIIRTYLTEIRYNNKWGIFMIFRRISLLIVLVVAVYLFNQYC